MNINGRYIPDEGVIARLSEMKLAVLRLPIDDPMRPYFEFLLGIIEANGLDIEEASDDRQYLQQILSSEHGPYSELLNIEL